MRRPAIAVVSCILRDAQKMAGNSTVSQGSQGTGNASPTVVSGAKKALECRNIQIYEAYKAGREIQLLADQYFLSVKSIQKIIRDRKPSDVSVKEMDRRDLE